MVGENVAWFGDESRSQTRLRQLLAIVEHDDDGGSVVPTRGGNGWALKASLSQSGSAGFGTGAGCETGAMVGSVSDIRATSLVELAGRFASSSLADPACSSRVS